MAYSLTKKQAEIYEYIRECLADKRYSPTLQEIADKFWTGNTSTAQYFVNMLIKKRWLSRDKNSQIRLGT